MLDADEQAFVIGGAALLPQVDELLLTEIDRDFGGDTHLPEFDRRVFREAARQVQRAAPPNAFDLAFVTYRWQP